MEVLLKLTEFIIFQFSAPPAEEEKAVAEVTEKMEEMKVEDTKTEASTEEETTDKEKTTEE